jgi:leucyl aminopeptidase
MPLVENMPSGSATRPGDIVKSFSGKTVEIGNTDAEGRLILVDAMAHAIKKYKPDTLIDLATLTGACIIGLGNKLAGVFSSDSSLSDAIVASGEITFERCWPMPLPEDYKELIKSDFADISNMASSRYGGAITAALFLSEFVGDTRWAHIDIAGPVYDKKGSDYCGPGGTGFGVRLLCDLIGTL